MTKGQNPSTGGPRRIRILDSETGAVLHEGPAPRPAPKLYTDRTTPLAGCILLSDGSRYEPSDPMVAVNGDVLALLEEDETEPETVESALARYAATGVALDPMAPIFMADSLACKALARKLAKEGKLKEAQGALAFSYYAGGLCRWVQ